MIPGGTPEDVPGLVLRLVHSHVVDLEGGREVLAETVGEAARALGVAALVAVALAPAGTGLGKAPGGGHGRVHEEIHGLRGDLRVGQPQVLSPDAVEKFPVQEPLEVSSAAVRVGWLPF